MELFPALQIGWLNGALRPRSGQAQDKFEDLPNLASRIR